MYDEWQLNGKATVDKMIIRYAEVLLSYAEALYEYNGFISDEQLDKRLIQFVSVRECLLD